MKESTAAKKILDGAKQKEFIVFKLVKAFGKKEFFN